MPPEDLTTPATPNPTTPVAPDATPPPIGNSAPTPTPIGNSPPTPTPPTPSTLGQAVKTAGADYAEVSAPLSQPIASPNNNVFNAIFGTKQNPTPSASFANLPPTPTAQPAVANGAPVAPIAPSNATLNAPSFAVSDQRAKEHIEPVSQEMLNQFYSSFKKKVR